MRNGNGKGTQQNVGKRGGGVGRKAVGQKRHRFADVNAARQASGDGRKDKRDKNVDLDQAEYAKYQHRQDDGVKEQVHQGASFGFLKEGNCGKEKLARASLF